MGVFVNTSTGVQFSVDDSKDERYRDGYEAPKAAKKAAASKSSK